MENNCVSLETAKRLKAAGFPQKTALHWILLPSTDKPVLLFAAGEAHPSLECQSAPQAQEIADQLPWRVEDIGYLQLGQTGAGSHWFARYTGLNSETALEGHGKTIVEALANLYLAIKEKPHD